MSEKTILNITQTFVKKYYTSLSKEPENVPKYYKESSSFSIRKNVTEIIEPAQGEKVIYIN